MNTTELKRCPFCGGEGKIVKLKVSFSDVYEGYAIHAECVSCGAKSPYKRGEFFGQFKSQDLDKAVEAWNRRVTDAS